jgi:hypothetical protein
MYTSNITTISSYNWEILPLPPAALPQKQEQLKHKYSKSCSAGKVVVQNNTRKHSIVVKYI